VAGLRGDTVAAVSSTAPQPSADEAESTESELESVPEANFRNQSKATRAVRAFARWWETPAALDVTISLVYIAFAFWITRGLWPTPSTRAIADNANDQALIEWFLAHGVLVWTGDFTFVTDRLNMPEGVNLMSNASHILHGVLMAPITAVFGAAVSFALLSAMNLAATAAGWYLLLARGLRLHRGAAILGGLLAGFGPGMISQANSHLHMTAQWLVPPIVYLVIRLTRVTSPRSTIITGVGLGLTITAQIFLGEEVLFLTAVCLVLFTVTYAATRPRWAREVGLRFVGGMFVAAGVTLILVAYPLWVQFAGRQHTPNAPFAPQHFYADLATFGIFSPLSLAGPDEPSQLATSSAEYNTFLGLPLLLVVAALICWRWRSPVTIALTVTGVVMTFLSLGPYVTLGGERTGWPSLYNQIAEVPVVNGALPTRYALALLPLIGVLLAYAVDAALRRRDLIRWLVPVAAFAAVLPTMPAPLAWATRAAVPTFISTGAWRQCAPEGGVIVPVPLPTPHQPDVMRWPAEANAAFAIPEGFFIGPYGPEGRSSIGIYPRPTSLLLAEVAKTGTVPLIDENQKAQAQRDLAYWRADCVAVAHVTAEPALRATLERLIGPGQAIADTWTWKVHR
jgi:hypothetical protein